MCFWARLTSPCSDFFINREDIVVESHENTIWSTYVSHKMQGKMLSLGTILFDKIVYIWASDLLNDGIYNIKFRSLNFSNFSSLLCAEKLFNKIRSRQTQTYFICQILVPSSESERLPRPVARENKLAGPVWKNLSVPEKFFNQYKHFSQRKKSNISTIWVAPSEMTS